MWGIFYNDTVTVFNKYIADDGSEKFLKTLLNKVNLTKTEGANISKSGLSEADSSKLYIMKSAYEGKYIPAKEWASLSNSEKPNYFTFNKGEDFFAEGDYTSLNVADYDLFEYMVNNYTHVYKVTTIDLYEDIMPHMEIGGR